MSQIQPSPSSAGASPGKPESGSSSSTPSSTQPSTASTPTQSQSVSTTQSASTLAAPMIGPDGTTITASSSGATLIHPVPTKPRSNSQLHSTRPAPPSPAPSRPGSQVLSPQLLASNFPSPSPTASRDRAGSTSSSSRGRRVSGSSHPSRTASKPRPRSALGASSFLPGSGGSEVDTAELATTESSLANSTIPEDRAVAPEQQPEKSEPEVIIRDYAFAKTDKRFAGPGLPLSAPEVVSRRSSGWDLGGSSEAQQVPITQRSARKSSSWSGFGLLNWRSLMGRRKGNDEAGRSGGDDEDDDDDEEDEDFRLPAPDHDEDDYAFSDSDSPSEEGEPWGFYRALFAFDAIGEHEIGLQEGTIVEVRGRGGGEGWVVAVKRRLDHLGRVVRLDEAEEGEGKEGLVPEGYLEKAGELEIAPPSKSAMGQVQPVITTSSVEPEAEAEAEPSDVQGENAVSRDEPAKVARDDGQAVEKGEDAARLGDRVEPAHEAKTESEVKAPSAQ